MSDECITDASGELRGRSLTRPSSSLSSADLSAETVFSVLADEHRQVVLTTLRESPDGAISVPVLATILRDHPEFTATRGEAAVHLHHNVIPKLAETGLVECDERSEIVRYVSHPRVEDALELAATWETGE